MLGDEVVSSAEAMRRIEKEIDAVRERAVGFVEFRVSGVSVPDGSTVAVEVGGREVMAEERHAHSPPSRFGLKIGKNGVAIQNVAWFPHVPGPRHGI